MNEQLQEKLTEILGSIHTAAGKASDFALEQLPDIAQSYVLYGRVYAVINTLSALILTAALAWGLRWAYKNPWKGEFGEARGPTNVLFMVAMAGLGLLTLAGAMSSTQELFLVWFAPKVWLLKQLATMVR